MEAQALNAASHQELQAAAVQSTSRSASSVSASMRPSFGSTAFSMSNSSINTNSEATYDTGLYTAAPTLFPGDAVMHGGFPSLNDCFQSWNIDLGFHDMMMEMDLFPSNTTATFGESLTNALDIEQLQAEHIRDIWYTRLPDSSAESMYPMPSTDLESGRASGIVTPRSGHTEIDDSYRERLLMRLRIPSQEPTIPSVDLLNVCIRLYFTKVHPVFPLIHAATFRPGKETASLMIALCAMGSLFTGSEHGLQQGIHLFQRIHKSTILQWEQMVLRNTDTLTSIVQCALICQMFGMLSGCPTLLFAVDAFHGPPIAWARYNRLHEARPPLQIDRDVDGELLNEVWRKWARNEELVRIAHGLYIIDAELGSLLHREPLQNFESYTFASTSSDTAFLAANAKDWKRAYLGELQHQNIQSTASQDRDHSLMPFDLLSVPVTSSLTAYAILEGISMRVLSPRPILARSIDSRREQQALLTQFQSRFLDSQAHESDDMLQLRILWNSVCINTYVDINLLERAVGRTGNKPTSSENNALTTWAGTMDAQRCVLHGFAIKKHVERASRLSELAMHVPRAVFWAGLALLCYIRYRPKDVTPRDSPSSKGAFYQESPLAGTDGEATSGNFSALAIDDPSSLKTTLYALTDILRHAGHWGIARQFAAILTSLCNFEFEHG